MPYHGYVIFFRYEAERIEIESILDAARNAYGVYKRAGEDISRVMERAVAASMKGELPVTVRDRVADEGDPTSGTK
jgi:hypothetical protein